MNVHSSSACSSRMSKSRNIRWLKRLAAVEARSSHRAMVLREWPETRAGRRDAHALDSQARDLAEFPSSAAKTAVRCSRVRAERAPADCATVPPPSARFRHKRAVAHEVEARSSKVVAPGLAARHFVDRVHRSSVTARRDPSFRPCSRSTANGASTPEGLEVQLEADLQQAARDEQLRCQPAGASGSRSPVRVVELQHRVVIEDIVDI